MNAIYLYLSSTSNKEPLRVNMGVIKNNKPISHKEQVAIKRLLDKHIGRRNFDYYTFDEKTRREILEEIAEESGSYPPRTMHMVQRIYKKLHRQYEKQSRNGCNFCGATLDPEVNNAHILAYRKYYKMCFGCSLKVINCMRIDVGRCNESTACYYCRKPLRNDPDKIVYRKYGHKRGRFRLCAEHKGTLNIPKDHKIMTNVE